MIEKKRVQRLKRELNLMDAVWMGLGSILGTGIFVSVGIAAGITGPSVILAITIAAFVATFNALSAAQLAATHAVSGGTYEYGYHYLGPFWGFLAGWTFLLAKSASAATAALGFAGYALAALGVANVSHVWLAFIVVISLTLVVLTGARRTSLANTVIVTMTLIALVSFVITGIYSRVTSETSAGFTPFFRGDGFADVFVKLFEATALMFVAYTGYGRIATLAEEVENPKKTIPQAIIATLIVSGVIYISVSVAGIGSVGAEFLYQATEGKAAPLTLAAKTFGLPYLPGVIAIGAATAMLGVLLNLILGLSRVLLAMGRRGDMPAGVTRLDSSHRSPWIAVATTGIFIALLTLVGSVKLTWSFSALTVLLYYAITNAAALAIPSELRLYPRWISCMGLGSCLFLTLYLDRAIWLSGCVLITAGAAWYIIARFMRSRQR